MGQHASVAVHQLRLTKTEHDLTAHHICTRTASWIKDDHGHRARAALCIYLLGKRCQRALSHLLGDLCTLSEARQHLGMHLVYAASADAVVRMIVEQMLPGDAEQPSRVA